MRPAARSRPAGNGPSPALTPLHHHSVGGAGGGRGQAQPTRLRTSHPPWCQRRAPPCSGARLWHTIATAADVADGLAHLRGPAYTPGEHAVPDPGRPAAHPRRGRRHDSELHTTSPPAPVWANTPVAHFALRMPVSASCGLSSNLTLDTTCVATVELLEGLQSPVLALGALPTVTALEFIAGKGNACPF